jgi:hypothetical protein
METHDRLGVQRGRQVRHADLQAIDDPAVVVALIDEAEHSIATIEAHLEFMDDGPEKRLSRIAALGCWKGGLRAYERHLASLERKNDRRLKPPEIFHALDVALNTTRGEK